MMVAEALEQRGHPRPFEGADKFLDYADVRAGLLQASSARDHYVFPHLTFQEYLAGLDLVRGVEFVQRILERRNDDRWRVPIQLGVGRLVSEGTLAGPYQLFNKLLKMKGRDAAQRQRDLLLVAELAEDVGWQRLIAGDELFEPLRDELAQALVPVVEGATLRRGSGPALPAAERVRAGVYLGSLGDPRPGVRDLPPAMVRISGGTFVLGSAAAEAERVGKALEQHYLAQGDPDRAKRARAWSRDEINDQPLTLPTFEIARYPLTNAQYKLFIDAGGYDPDAPWWQADPDARAWLLRDDVATEGLQPWQRRTRKDRPELWEDPNFGIVRPNHPVVGVSWFEAAAFCRWLTQQLDDGSVYCLPSEAEWEYAARRATRRTFPWGEAEPDSERCNFAEIYGGTSAVGCFAPGATPEDGIHDLAGNVWEWTRSEYRPYPYDPADGREGATETSQKQFTLRGGSWHTHRGRIRCPYRRAFLADRNFLIYGFRLAHLFSLPLS